MPTIQNRLYSGMPTIQNRLYSGMPTIQNRLYDAASSFEQQLRDYRESRGERLEPSLVRPWALWVGATAALAAGIAALLRKRAGARVEAEAVSRQAA